MIPREILKKIRQIELRTNRLVSETLGGQYHSVFKGQGMNFEEVREYQPGDEVRAIDWNVTARMNHPFVKKFIEERELTLMLIVDLSGSGLFGSGDQAKRELAAEIASVLAFSAIRNNDKVGLILFTDEIEEFMPPRKGRRHVLRVIREILFFEPLYLRYEYVNGMRQNKGDMLPLHFTGAHHPIGANREGRCRAWFDIDGSLAFEQAGSPAKLLHINRRNNVDIAAQESGIQRQLQR